MDKIFNVEIDGQITLPDGRKLGPFEETTVNVVQPSECASDPIVENAKQTGGFGYTEQGEQTVITWDGDTDGKTVVDDFWCKVSTNIVPNSDIIGMEFSAGGESVKVDQEYYEGLVSSGALTDELVYVSDFVVLVRQENAIYDGHLFEETGVYFGFEGDVYVESLTYGTPDTIHKIDEKYLPASGGVTTLHINVSAVDWETFETTFTADKTVYEMENCFTPTWCVVTFAAGTFSDDEEVSFGIPPSWLGGATCFGRIVLPNHNDGGNNEVITAVTRDFDYNWVLDLRAFGT